MCFGDCEDLRRGGVLEVGVWSLELERSVEFVCGSWIGLWDLIP